MGVRPHTGPVVVEVDGSAAGLGVIDYACGEAGPEKTMRTHRRRRRLAWALGWAGAAIVAVGNGGLRDLVLVDVLAERPARQLSTVTLLILLAAYLWWLNRTWTLPTTAVALRVGAAWAATTLLFEFGLGHYVEHKSWAVLLADYDLTRGHIWILVPIWTAIGPAVVQRLQARRVPSTVSISDSVRTNH